MLMSRNGKEIIVSDKPSLAASGTIKAVLFDLDNTLFNRDLAFHKWAQGFVAEKMCGESEDYRAQALEQIVGIDSHGYTTKEHLFTQVRVLYPVITEEVQTLCDRFYREWLVHMVLDPQTVLLLDALDSENIPYGIVTNGPSQQHHKIQQLGLHHRTTCIFVSAEYGCNKPDPSIFRAAAASLGLPCENILFVGDNPEADMCGAHAVGMQTAWIHCGATWPEALAHVEPDHVIGSLGELMALLPA